MLFSMFHNMGIGDVCDIGLGLGLGSQGRHENGSKSNDLSKKPCFRFENLFPSTSTSSELYLALGLSDEALQMTGKTGMKKMCEDSVDVNRQASPSFSNTRVKREREVGSVEVELERVSSRVSDEDDDCNAKKKLRLTKEQSALLESSFKEHTTLNPKQKQALAKQLKLRPRQVEVWFQNRRARTKLKQTEVDCELLKKCCETLTEENRRLHKELRDLKALKLSTPMYKKLSAATLTMCPSCERIGGGGIDTTKDSFVVAPKPHLYHPFIHPSTAC